MRYGWTHVVVVRNSFPPRADDGTTLAPAPSGLVYAGRVDAHRELETVLGAAPMVDLPITLVGPADDVWVGRNAAAITATGTSLQAALPVDEVTALLRRAGLALVTHSDRFESHLLALPNKLFHAVHAGVPVIATDVPELAAVVREHDLGETYRPGDARGLAAAVGRALDRYPGLLDSVAAATEALSWPADSAALRGVYARLEARSAS